MSDFSSTQIKTLSDMTARLEVAILSLGVANSATCELSVDDMLDIQANIACSLHGPQASDWYSVWVRDVKARNSKKYRRLNAVASNDRVAEFPKKPKQSN